MLIVALSRNSCVVYDASKPKRPTSMQLASVESLKRSSRRIRQSNVLAVAAVGVLRVTEYQRGG